MARSGRDCLLAHELQERYRRQRRFGNECCATLCGPLVLGLLLGMLYNGSAIATVRNSLAIRECFDIAMSAAQDKANTLGQTTPVTAPILYYLQSSTLGDNMLFSFILSQPLFSLLPTAAHIFLSMSWRCQLPQQTQRNYIVYAGFLSVAQFMLYAMLTSNSALFWALKSNTHVKAGGCQQLGLFAKSCLQGDSLGGCSDFIENSDALSLEKLDELPQVLSSYLLTVFDDSLGGEGLALTVILSSASMLMLMWNYHLTQVQQESELALTVEPSVLSGQYMNLA